MAKYKKVYKKGKSYTVTKSDGSKITRYGPGRYVRVKVDDNKSSSGSSSKEMVNFNVSLDQSGNIETYTETKNGITTTRITDRRTGKSVRKSGSSSYNSLSKEEKETINPASQKVDVEALRKKLQEEQKTKGLRAKRVDIKTGRIVDQGNFKVNRDFERRLSSFEKQHGKLNPTQKINLASYEQVFGKKADPKSQDVRELLKVRSISPTLQQQLNQKQTTSRDLKKYIDSLNPPREYVKVPDLGRTKLREFNQYMEDQRRKAIRGDKNAKASLIGVSSLPTNLLQSGSSLIIGLVESALNPKETLEAISSLTAKDIQNGGAKFGSKLQSGDPSALTDVVVQMTPLRFGKVKNINKVDDVVKSNTNDLTKINSRINTLEKQGTNVRQRTLEGKELRELKETKKVLTSDLKDLDKIIKARDKPAFTKKEKKQQVKEVKQVVNNFKKRNSKRKKQEKTLEQFEKERLAQNKGSKLKIKNAKPMDEVKYASEKRLIELLNDNYANGTLFKRLRKAIETKTGKKVLIRQKVSEGIKVKGNKAKKGNIGKVQIKLVDKKTLTQLKKGEKKKVKKINLKDEVKLDLNKKELRELQKKSDQIELDLLNGRVDKVVRQVERNQGLFKNKKGQAMLFKSTGKSYKKLEKVTKDGVTKTKKFIDDYRKRVETANKQNKELVRKGKKSKDFSKSERERFAKQKKKLDKDLKDNIKKVKAFDKSLVKLAKVVPALALASKSLQGTLSQQAKLLDKAQDVLQKQELKLDKVTPNKGSGKGSPKGGKGGKPSGGSSRTTKTTKTPTPKPKGGRGKLKTPDPKPKPKPKIKSSSDKKKVKFSKVTTKGEIIYTNEKGSKVKIKTGLPYDWAYKVALETVDESLLGSTKVRKYGKVKSRNGLAFNNDLLKKFRDKKSKNPRVNEIVEKAKHRLDTKSEVSSIQAKKVLASKLKIAKETIKELKKASKKTSRSKTIKKVKKSPKTSLKSKRKGGKR